MTTPVLPPHMRTLLELLSSLCFGILRWLPLPEQQRPSGGSEL